MRYAALKEWNKDRKYILVGGPEGKIQLEIVGIFGKLNENYC